MKKILKIFGIVAVVLLVLVIVAPLCAAWDQPEKPEDVLGGTWVKVMTRNQTTCYTLAFEGGIEDPKTGMVVRQRPLYYYETIPIEWYWVLKFPTYPQYYLTEDYLLDHFTISPR